MTVKQNLYTSSAVASGGLVAIIIFINGELARYTSPAWSSLIAHFVGIFGSWFLWKTLSGNKGLFPFAIDVPKWAYFGGAVGAMIVVISNMTVNSSIGLVGSLSIMILAQMIIAIVFDFKGWFGVARRNLSASDFLQVACILVGSILIIYY